MKKEILIRGKKLYIREIKKSDLNKKYLSWLNNPDITKYMMNSTRPTTKKDIMSYYNKLKKSKDDLFLAVCLNKNKKHIGNVRLGPINRFHRRSEFGIMIGDKKSWGKGYAYEATSLILRYAFNELNMNRINIGVIDGNARAFKLYKKLGFKKEGVIRKNFYLDGKYLDSIKMGILKEEFIKTE